MAQHTDIYKSSGYKFEGYIAFYIIKQPPNYDKSDIYHTLKKTMLLSPLGWKLYTLLIIQYVK
jgi:hypothetical protein